MTTQIIRKWDILRGRFEWRWRIKARNGRIIGASSEGFSSRRAASHNLLLMRSALNRADLFAQPRRVQ